MNPSNEALARIKRAHTDQHPAIHINPGAVLRNKIVQYLGTKPYHRATKEEFDQFCSCLADDPDVGRSPNSSWTSNNSHLIARVQVGSQQCVRLTKVGRRVLAHLGDLSEEPEDKIGGIEFVGGPWVGDGGNPSPPAPVGAGESRLPTLESFLRRG